MGHGPSRSEAEEKSGYQNKKDEGGRRERSSLEGLGKEKKRETSPSRRGREECQGRKKKEARGQKAKKRHLSHLGKKKGTTRWEKKGLCVASEKASRQKKREGRGFRSKKPL